MKPAVDTINDSEILNHIYNDSGRKGELIAMRFRWFLMALVSILIFHMYTKGLKEEAVYSMLPVLIFGLYNLLLLYLLKKPKIKPWVRYVSTTIDIGVLSLHIFNYARLFEPIAVATAASIFLYPVLMFLAVLRYDRKLILYSTGLTLLFFNLNYFLFQNQLSAGLMDTVVSSNAAGQLYKSGYFLFLGYLYMHIPKLLSRLLAKHKHLYTEKNKTEIALAREQERVATQKELNGTLSQLNFTKDKLFSIIGHDVKNPFSVIYSLSKTLIDQRENLQKDEMVEAMQKIHSTSGKGLDLLQNLLNWSRVQRNIIQPQPEFIDVYPLAFDVLLLFEQQADEKNITLNNDIDKKHQAFIDQEMIHIVLRNIISNSIKYTRPSGKITVRSEYENNLLRIEVEDNGTGIPETTLNALVTRRLYKSTPGTMNEKGTGLGMLIVQDFVHALGGKIQIQSVLEKGTTIGIVLPQKSIKSPSKPCC